MKTTLTKPTRLGRKTVKVTPHPARTTAADIIRKLGDDWARFWNAGDLDKIVAAYAEDAVYLPPHHAAVHGRDAIREYLRFPQVHGVSELAFDLTYVKQSGAIAWDVGTYRMSVRQKDGTIREDHGKYLTVWQRFGVKWLIVADAWSSDIPAGAAHSTVGLA